VIAGAKLQALEGSRAMMEQWVVSAWRAMSANVGDQVSSHVARFQAVKVEGHRLIE
jgi:hypothetical protein